MCVVDLDEHSAAGFIPPSMSLSSSCSTGIAARFCRGSLSGGIDGFGCCSLGLAGAVAIRPAAEPLQRFQKV
jgi:hypothetical protein